VEKDPTSRRTLKGLNVVIIKSKTKIWITRTCTFYQKITVDLQRDHDLLVRSNKMFERSEVRRTSIRITVGERVIHHEALQAS
jgi:hypothetical protein